MPSFPSLRWALAASALLYLALVSSASPAAAHGMRTAYLEVVEAQAGHATMRFRLPVAAPEVQPVLPQDCSKRRLGPPAQTDSGLMVSFAVRCDSTLRGRTLGLSGLGVRVSEAAVYYVSPKEEASAGLLDRSHALWTVPGGQPPAPMDAATHYLQLGLSHIAAGYDHLIFIVLLVLLLRRPRTVLLAELAFACSHTLSYFATAFGWVRLPVAATEACIALTLVMLALDVDLHGDRPSPSLRSSAGLALVFGLVHGLGFAGGLQDAGLPAAHAGMAALGFGLGVEVGQVLCSLLALAVLGLGTRLGWERRAVLVSTYGLGGIASYWFLVRMQAVLLPTNA